MFCETTRENLSSFVFQQYTIEDISNKNGAQNETDEIYYKCDDYYDYYLVGVIVHVGSADSGHYYSYINTVRDGNGNIARYDIKNEKMNKSWLEFNDSSISKFNVENLEEECFGGVGTGRGGAARRSLGEALRQPWWRWWTERAPRARMRGWGLQWSAGRLLVCSKGSGEAYI